jgi:8-oxo-dGTP pyrophosphatase MutT (NUDIX family)
MQHTLVLTLPDVEMRLRAAFASGLPGSEAQARMAPRPRPGWPASALPPDTRLAAALLLLFPTGDGPGLVLTKRADDLPQHPGQVSLPGGAIEPGEGVEGAALREAHEEVGVEPSAVRVLGVLTPLHIPVSGFAVHPVVGVTDPRPALRPHGREVERVLEIAIRDLADPLRVCLATRARDGREYEVPYFDVAGEQVWGATAMMLAEFLTVLGAAPDPWSAANP